MSTQYQSGKDVPTEVLVARLKELADVVARKRDRIGVEFTMRIPAERDRDADLVMSEAARRLSAVPDVQGEPVGWQFYQDGKWWYGDDRIKDHRKNTEEAGFLVRDVYAAPQPAEQKPAPDVSALVEALESIAKLPIDPCSTENDYRLSAAKAIASAAISAHRKQGGSND